MAEYWIMKITRKLRRHHRRTDALQTRAENTILKNKERSRRDARMIEKIRGGSLPYSPIVMSWLSRKLGAKSSRITQDQVNTLLA